MNIEKIIESIKKLTQKNKENLRFLNKNYINL